MTRGGPGFTSDVIASVIYKQYQAGFYGLSTAGNVVLFVLVAVHHRAALRCSSTAGRWTMNRRLAPALARRLVAILASIVVFIVPFAFIILTAFKDKQQASLRDFSLAATASTCGTTWSR